MFKSIFDKFIKLVLFYFSNFHLVHFNTLYTKRLG
jgi:hypothetical protein